MVQEIFIFSPLPCFDGTFMLSWHLSHIHIYTLIFVYKVTFLEHLMEIKLLIKYMLSIALWAGVNIKIDKQFMSEL